MSDTTVKFQQRLSIEQVEEGNDLAPKFDDRGLITVVTTDAGSGEVLMQGYMNTDALQLTIRTGEAHYWSRSREVLWHKGATSGFVQRVRELLIDDDQDCIWLRVHVEGGASWPVDGGAQGWGPGDERFLQSWYRSSLSPCGFGFNTSNGLRVKFQP